jgi:hypothetical protein
VAAALVRINPASVAPEFWLTALATATLLLFVAFQWSEDWLPGLEAWNERHPISFVLLGAIAVTGVLVSGSLRRVAAHCLERELVQTLAVARLFGHHF